MSTHSPPRVLDLNTVTQAELAQVPGLTPTLAQRIIAHRPFKQIKELLHVRGVSPEIFRVAIGSLTVGPAKGPAVEATSRPAVHAPVHPNRDAAPPSQKHGGWTLVELPAEAASPPAKKSNYPYSAFQSVQSDTLVEAEIYEPEVVVIEEPAVSSSALTRQETGLIPEPSRSIIVHPLSRLANLMFASYIGPRIIFILFSVVLAVILIAFGVGLIDFNSNSAPAAAVVSPADRPVGVQFQTAVIPTGMPSTALPSLPPTLLVPTSTAVPTVVSPTATFNFLSNAGMEGAEKLIFNETFAAPGYWDLGENEFSNIFIEQERLVVQMKQAGAIAWTLNGSVGHDFFYQADVAVGPCRLGDNFGLVFRSQSNGQRYFFALSCDGQYRVTQQQAENFHDLINFTFTPYATTGSNSTNLLAVRAVGGQLGFYINDQFVATLANADPAPGIFGIFARSAETSDLRVEFDDISAWEIKP